MFASRNSSLPRGLPRIGPVTRPHTSANILRKPFKTPFKTPFKVPGESQIHVTKENDRDRQAEQVIPPPPVENRYGPKVEESEDDVEIVEVQIKQEPGGDDDDGAADDQSKPHRSRSGVCHRIDDAFLAVDIDMEIPEVQMEVEVSFSRKIPVRDSSHRRYHTRSRTRLARDTNERIQWASQGPPSGLSPRCFLD